MERLKAEVQAQRVQVIDVREADEWKAGHLKCAQWHPLSQIQIGVAPKLAKDQAIYLHCRSGKRSQTAAALLQALGFTKVVSLNESFQQLHDSGL